MFCINCNKETNNPKFCNRSCAATYNNKHYIKRTAKINLCKSCGSPTILRRKYCSKCNSISRLDYTLDQATKVYRKHHRSALFNLVRSRAKPVMNQNNILKICYNCGYNKHVEVCHIISLFTFPLTAKLSEVNHIKNLVYLCPNCHWEFDNGLINIL